MGKSTYAVASTLVNLGNAYGALGQVAKQRELLERALVIEEAHYGKEHYAVASTLASLGNAYGALGQVAKQRELLERALVIEEAHYGKEHYAVASTLANLGNAYGSLGQVGKQRELLERALVIQEAHYGKEHYAVASTLANLGNAYGALGRVGKQRELLERALPILEAHYGAMHREVAITLTNLAVAYQVLKQPQAALQAAQRAYRILMAHAEYGASHPRTKQHLQYLQSAGGFTLAMLQSSDAILEEKQSTISSVPLTSPPPQESQIAAKTPVSAFPMDFNTDRFTDTVECRVSYDSTVHHYFSDLAERMRNDPQGRPLITVQNSLSSTSTSFTVSLSTMWLRQMHQSNQENFQKICHQLGVHENKMLAQIGLTDLNNRERKEDKFSRNSDMPLTQPSLFSAASIGSVSSSTSMPTVPLSNLRSPLTSHSSASLFSSTTQQFSGNNPSFALLSGVVSETKEKNTQTKKKRKREGEESEEDTALASNPKSPKPKPPGGTSDEET